MRLWILPVALVGFLIGCNKSEKGGNPADNKNNFTLDLPGLSKDVGKDIKQGTTETYEGKISRGSEFKDDVALTVDSKPEKVSVKLNPSDVKASTDGKFSIEVKADDDAPLGESDVKITAKPKSGTAVTSSFKLKVTKK